MRRVIVGMWACVTLQQLVAGSIPAAEKGQTSFKTRLRDRCGCWGPNSYKTEAGEDLRPGGVGSARFTQPAEQSSPCDAGENQVKLVLSCIPQQETVHWMVFQTIHSHKHDVKLLNCSSNEPNYNLVQNH